MGEVSVVAQLIQTLLAVAFGTACLGTLGEMVFAKKDQAAYAVKHQGMSYGRWNRQLLAGSGACTGIRPIGERLKSTTKATP